mmetsp:Transcript_26988/g.66822  ORF Transcript_26988/g.66822 Transcript_26988/m.66822 type:complete len:96 (+) Transcript_26988:433-720(+)
MCRRLGLSGTEQSALAHPFSHTQLPATHLPRPEQSCLHVVFSQALPEKPGLQLHPRSVQKPLPEHESGHRVTEQSSPVHLGLQLQGPASVHLQVP